MEEELDKIEEGEMNWVAVLKNFYGPFEKRLLEAKEKMKNIKKEVIPAGEDCEKCGKAMVIKYGRYGKFVACSGFPECRNTKPLSTGVGCEKDGCDGYLVSRRGRGGRRFYGCSNYPKCDFITNKLPDKEEAKKEKEEKPPETDATGDAS